MTILSLGKLGGQELNYSSDIDLLFLYGSPAPPAARKAARPTPNISRAPRRKFCI